MRWRFLTWMLVFVAGGAIGWFVHGIAADKPNDDLTQIKQVTLDEPSTQQHQSFHVIRVCDGNTKQADERAFLREWQGWRINLYSDNRVLVLCIEN